jgi:hypothetical protein
MARRLSREDRERIRQEVHEMVLAQGSPKDKVKKQLSCGHEDYVLPSVDLENAVCWACASRPLPARVAGTG